MLLLHLPLPLPPLSSPPPVTVQDPVLPEHPGAPRGSPCDHLFPLTVCDVLFLCQDQWLPQEVRNSILPTTCKQPRLLVRIFRDRLLDLMKFSGILHFCDSLGI